LQPGDFFEANMMNSVFSELSLSILHPIHAFSSSMSDCCHVRRHVTVEKGNNVCELLNKAI